MARPYRHTGTRWPFSLGETVDLIPERRKGRMRHRYPTGGMRVVAMFKSKGNRFVKPGTMCCMLRTGWPSEPYVTIRAAFLQPFAAH